LGQNFISDANFLNSILDKLDLKPTETIVEIGTGAGALTKCIAARAKHVISYEVDERLKSVHTEFLRGVENIEVIFQDVLKVDEISKKDYRLVANIPYYITTPIILKFLRDERCREICILVQDDVARRIIAKPGTKDYGALSVTVQSRAECKIIKQVSRVMFRPMPKVDSAFVVIKKSHSMKGEHLAHFDRIVKGMFAARRKTVLNALRSTLKIDAIDAMNLIQSQGIDSTIRPEQLTVEQYVKLSHIVT